MSLAIGGELKSAIGQIDSTAGDINIGVGELHECTISKSNDGIVVDDLIVMDSFVVENSTSEGQLGKPKYELIELTDIHSSDFDGDVFDFKAPEAPAPAAPGVAEQLGYGGLQQTFAIEIDMNPERPQPLCYLQYNLDRASEIDDGKDDLATYQPDTVDIDLSLLAAVDTGGIPVSMGEYGLLLI